MNHLKHPEFPDWTRVHQFCHFHTVSRPSTSLFAFANSYIMVYKMINRLFIKCFHEVFGSKVAHYILPCHSTWLIGQRGRQWLIQASLTPVARTMSFVEIYRVNSIFYVEADADNSQPPKVWKSGPFCQIAALIQNNLWIEVFIVQFSHTLNRGCLDFGGFFYLIVCVCTMYSWYSCLLRVFMLSCLLQLK